MQGPADLQALLQQALPQALAPLNQQLTALTTQQANLKRQVDETLSEGYVDEMEEDSTNGTTTTATADGATAPRRSLRLRDRREGSRSPRTNR